MGYHVKILADSIAKGVRLTTMEVTFPRFILAEFNTHRSFSRNSSSSRAVPVETKIQQVKQNPFVPDALAANQRGMQAGKRVDGWREKLGRWTWLLASRVACFFAWVFSKLGIHKQWANRLIETFSWHTVVVTSTEWQNFFNLRTHKDAQPEMQHIAKLMLAAFNASTPIELAEGDWHLPYIDRVWDSRAKRFSVGHQDFVLANAIRERHESLEDGLVKMSVVRCAAISFERQQANRTHEEFLKRFNQMRRSAHWSPFEHQARVSNVEAWDANDSRVFIGNFRAPWQQLRKTFPGEAVWQPPVIH